MITLKNLAIGYGGNTVISGVNLKLAAGDFLVIGGTEDPDDEPSSFDQTWNGLGAKTKNESGDVTCAVLVGTGNEDVKVARDRAIALLGEIEAKVRADPSLGGVLTGGWCQESESLRRSSGAKNPF